MPGRNDFGVLAARALSDARIARAADLYVELRIARKETALAAVLGHVAMLGLWASQVTDDGRIEGDGVAAVRTATLSTTGVAQRILGALTAPGVDLVTRDDSGLRIRGVREAYGALLLRRADARERQRRKREREEAERAEAESRHASHSRDVTRDGAGRHRARVACARAGARVCASARAQTCGRSGVRPEPGSTGCHA